LNIKVSSDGNNVYVSHAAANAALTQYKRNPNTGALSALSPLSVALGSDSYGSVFRLTERMYMLINLVLTL